MTDHPTTPPPLGDGELLSVMAAAASAYINGHHPDLPPMTWIPINNGVIGDLADCYSRPPEEVAAIGAAWAQRLDLEQVDAHYAGQVRYRGPVGTISQVEITLTIDRGAHRADLDARLAAWAAKAGER